ncbi:Ubiquitin-conjugating enzyme [Mycena sanguinolenta]|uniref:Ubiquitin-conjugating enzyme n=1 Tax=Mycena sanguinolenta TaxID=230812 RepID=A0A8H6XXU5_9AGAR|nr:Ubiquitin-conjugating enzyme [Mycena sanguinolenta]
MASRLTRQSFSATVRAARSVRSNVHPAKRFMSADATAGHHHEFKPKSDMPWIIGAAVIAGPALAYLLRDTMEIKRKIAAGHHGHDSHDAHAAHEEKHDDHASKAVAKEDEGEKTEASSTNAEDDAAKADESTPDAAAEPPKEEKESEKNEKEEESK